MLLNRKSLMLALFPVVFFQTACVTQLTSKGERIHRVDDRSKLDKCTFIEDYHATSMLAGIFNNLGMASAVNDAYNRAALVSGTHIWLKEQQKSFSDNQVVQVEIYRCN